MKKHSERGFIALISALIISAILLIALVASNLTGFYSRFNILDSELKERSNATADACADIALLQFALDPMYAGGTLNINSIDECRVGKIVDLGSTLQFSVQSTSSGSSVTNLQVVINAGDLSVVSWQEIAIY